MMSGWVEEKGFGKGLGKDQRLVLLRAGKESQRGRWRRSGRVGFRCNTRSGAIWMELPSFTCSKGVTEQRIEQDCRIKENARFLHDISSE